MTSILVGLDGSARSEKGLPWVRLLSHGRPVLLLQVVEPVYSPDLGGPLILADVQQHAAEYLDRLSRTFTPQAESLVRLGSPASTILEVAQEKDVDLIAITTHGGSPVLRRVFGGTTERLIHGSTVPLLIVPSWGDTTPPHVGLRKILVPLDGSNESASIVPLVGQLAHREDSEIVLVHAVTERDGHEERLTELRDFFSSRAAQMANEGMRVRSVVVKGKAPQAILRVARREGANLIMMSAHGYGAVKRMLFGSVASKLIRETPIPVIVAKYSGTKSAVFEEVMGTGHE